MMLFQLLISFLQVGLFSVGGGYAAIPLIQNQIVNVHGMMSMAQFTDLITIAEMTPGPISINSATFVGTQLAGPLGSILCTLGVVVPSFVICLTLAHFYYKYRSFGGVQKVLAALRPAVVALIASAGLSILVLGLFNAEIGNIAIEDFRIIEFVLFLGAFYILRRYKVSAIKIIFGTGIIGTLCYVPILLM